MILATMTMQEQSFEKQFDIELTEILDEFYNLLLLFNQNILVVNFSCIDLKIVHVIISYNTREGRPVKLEAFGKFGPTYQQILKFVREACKRAILEAAVDLSGPFIPLTFPLGYI